jgi:uncharacterized membrane protein (UPF0127 family)
MPYREGPTLFTIKRRADTRAATGMEGSRVWRHHRVMKPFALPSLVLTLALSLPGAFAPAAALAPTEAQATLPIVTLKAGIHVIRAELADNARTRQLGLMHRESLAPNHGMLFVFERKGGHCFWMRNTLIPLSIAFLDDDGTIVNIVDMAPHSEESHCPERAVRFALEMDAGWFEKRGLGAGSKLVNRELFEPQR